MIKKNKKKLMECNKCHKIKKIDDFSYYNKNNRKIYYLNCNICKEKLTENTDIKEKQKEEYENRKINNIINCECGISYIAFREYHTIRHNNSKKHKNYYNSSHSLG